MKTTVDHGARRREIIRNSVKLFARLGYKNVSFRELSAECGVARTVLYRYFNNKRQIFDAAILEVMAKIRQKHSEIIHAKLPAGAKIHQICTVVTATLFDNRDFLGVIIDFVMEMKRSNHDMGRRIRIFTIGLKRVMHTLLTWGVRHGEFRAGLDTELYTDLIYTQFESAVLRLTVSDDAAIADVMNRIEEILKGVEAK